MNPAQLLAHFDRVSEAPDAIPRLRRFILDLAVRGKLVEQDPKDESASELLKRLEVEKNRLVSAAIVDRERARSFSEGELPFRIPQNWRWSQLAEIGIISPRNSADNSLNASFVPMKMIPAEYGVRNSHEVRPWGEIKKGFTHFAEGDVALAKITPCFENGKSAVFRGLMGGIGAGTTELHVVRPVAICADYVLIFLKCPHFIRAGIPRMTGTAGQKRVPVEYFAHSPFPLPPVDEQHRIVAKVLELMALCDRLEAAQAERERRRDRLVAVSLQRLNESGEAAAFRAHARFYLNHLHRLTSRPEHVRQLRQTILNLAVRGKLVEQDPNDEPASELLKRIRAEKARQATGSKDVGDRGIRPLRTEGVPFLIPSSWKWSPLGEITVSRDGERIPVSKEERNRRAKTYDYYGASGVIDKIDGYLFDRPLLLVGEDGANLINRSTPIAFIARGEYWVNNHAHVLDGISVEFLRFIELHINAIDLKPYVTGTAQPKMNQAKMNSIYIAVPPLAEQYRILAKVDELMALCDRLEAQLNVAQAESSRLLESILHQALDGITRTAGAEPVEIPSRSDRDKVPIGSEVCA